MKCRGEKPRKNKEKRENSPWKALFLAEIVLNAVFKRFERFFNVPCRVGRIFHFQRIVERFRGKKRGCFFAFVSRQKK